MPSPSFDKSTGWWSIRITDAKGTRTKILLARQEGWTRGMRPPKKVPSDIELLARPYLDQAMRARHGVDASAARETRLAAHLENYLVEFERTHAKNSVLSVRRAVKLFLTFCGVRGVDTLQRVDQTLCREFLESMFGKYKRGSVVLLRSVLSPIWTRARQDRLLQENPWELVAVPGKPDRRPPKFWTEEELSLLLAELSGWLKDLVLLGVNCGGRITSLLTLRWDAVDFDAGKISLDSKTGYYEVPLAAVAREVLARRKAVSQSPWVFPSKRTGQPHVSNRSYQALRRAVRRAGIPEKGSYNHILRHTFASHALMRGVPLATVSKWLGHTNIAMTMRYSHLCESESQRQMDRFRLGE